MNFESKANSDKYYDDLESDVFDIKEVNKLAFQFQMRYNGSNSVKFTPIGKSTTVCIDSDWQNPSFEGVFSSNTSTKSITKKNFMLIGLFRKSTDHFRKNIRNIYHNSTNIYLASSLLKPLTNISKMRGLPNMAS